MPANLKIALVAFSSFAATMLIMAVVSSIPGIEPVPLHWWIVAGIIPVVISAPVSWLLGRQAEYIRRLNAELNAAYQAVKHAAETDHLTGVANRAAFDARVAALHDQRPGWFLVVDIDRFKDINDRHGHALGDTAIAAVAAALTRTIGPDNLVGRIGGEEFAVFLPAAGATGALEMAEAIRRAVAGLAIAGAGEEVMALTVSVGVTGGAGLSVATGLSAADRAMYRAKQDGRDRVQFDG